MHIELTVNIKNKKVPNILAFLDTFRAFGHLVILNKWIYYYPKRGRLGELPAVISSSWSLSLRLDWVFVATFGVLDQRATHSSWTSWPRKNAASWLHIVFSVKYYFAIVFSVINFQQNKRHLNRPWASWTIRIFI